MPACLSASTTAPEVTFITSPADRDRRPSLCPDSEGSASAFAIPQTAWAAKPPLFPGYQVLGKLGRGSMGAVYKARQLRLNRIVALKFVHDLSQVSSDDLVRFLADAEVLACLKHPHIVAVHEFGQVDGRPYFAMEYVSGGTLAEALDKGLWAVPNQQTYRAAAELVATLAETVHYAHQQGIVHRDIKPANILLQRTEDRGQRTEAEAAGTSASVLCPLSSVLRPKITDFGLAKRLAGDLNLTEPGGLVGTPRYMAPEQAEGKAELIGPPTDIHALGVVLYELLTGRPPYQAENLFWTLKQVAADPPVPPRRRQPQVPRDLEIICLKCLEKEPGRRYASACALAADLRRYLRGEPIRARQTPVWESVGRWVKRQPEEMAFWTTTALALVTAVGLMLGADRSLLCAGILAVVALATAWRCRSTARPGEAQPEDAAPVMEEVLTHRPALAGELPCGR